MNPIYAQDGTTIIGYGVTIGYATWTYNTSYQAQGITLDANAISSGALTPIVVNTVTTGYTYTDSVGATYNFSVDATGAVTGYTSTYSGVGYSYTYNFNALGVFSGYSHVDGNTTKTYDASWTLISTVTVTPSNMVAIVDANNTTIGWSVTDGSGTTTKYATDQTTVTGYSYTYSYTDINNQVITTVSNYDANWNYLSSETKDGTGKVLYSNSYSYDPTTGAFTGYTDFDGVTTTVYDANWKVVSSTANTGNLTPDGAGGFYSTDAYGTITTYDGTGAVTGYRYSYTDTWNHTTSISTYDKNWNFLSSETKDSAGNVIYSSSYSYDANGKFTGYTYFDGVTTTVYDANWNVVSSTANTANMTELRDPVTNNLIGYSHTDAYGTTTTYDTTGALTGYTYRYTNWDGSVSVSSYDANWNYLSGETRDAQGSLLYSYTYSYVNGVFDGYTYFDGVTTTVYNANWQVVSSTANMTNMTPIYATPGDSTTAIVGYSNTDQWGTTTTYNVSGAVTGYSYRYTNWDGSISVSSYDANWNYLSGETRDAQGGLLYSYTYSYTNGVYSGYTYFDGVTTTVYDANWNVVSTTASTTNMTPILDGAGATVGYSYTDAYGNTTTYDLNGTKTGSIYSSTNSWDNSTTLTTYDKNGNYLSSETKDSTGKVLYSNSYSYDANGVFTGYTYFDGVTTTKYDANWNVLSSTASTTNMTPILDGAGATVGYSYTDAYGNTTTYDQNGAKTGSIYSYTNSWDNSTTLTTYDKNGNYLGSETKDSAGKVLYSNSYSYDANGVFTGYTYFDGVTTTVYDANWNVLSSTASTANMTPILDGAGATVGYSHTDAYGNTTTYDTAGLVTGYSYKTVDSVNNTTSVTTYDKNWFFISTVTTNNTTGNELYRTEYSYDANGNFAGYTYFDGITTTVYDANWQVLSSTQSTANMIPVYDANNLLTGYYFTDAWGTKTNYDAAGVKTGSVNTYVDTWSNTTTVTTYGANGNYLSSETKNTTTGTVLSSNSYSYDTNGNFTGYTSFDGVTTTVYNANWQIVSSTTDLANLTEVRNASNVLTGYSYTDAWGTTTNYDTAGVKTGSVYSYTNWDGSKSLSHYDANGSYLGWSNVDVQGNVLSSSMYNYVNGNYNGYTYFDGIVTTVYDAFGSVVGTPTIDFTKLTPVYGANGATLTGYSKTDTSGTTTYYDTTGVKTGSVYSYTNWDGTKSLSYYDANGSYVGWGNTDAQGKVLSSTMYNYVNGNYTGYTSFDGITTTVYDSFGAVLSSTVDLTKLTPVYGANGTTLTGYSKTDTSGTTTYYDTTGVKTGSVYSYTNWDGTKSLSYYDANGSYIGWGNTDAQGKMLSSTMYNYVGGNYTGYTTFDGITTTVYDSFGAVLSSTVDLTKLTQVFAADGTTLTGYSKTDTSGTTTYYDTTGVKTGSSYTYTYSDGTKSISHYDANGSYIGSSNTDAAGKVLSSYMYNYDSQGNYIGYTSFDGVTTSVYDSNYNLISATANTANMTPLDANGNVLVDANRDGFDDVNTTVAVVGYKFTDAYGTTSYFSLSGVKTGSSSSYTNWDGTINISHYNASGSYIGWSNTDAQGKVLSSSMYNYTNGIYSGYTYFDGVTTTVYDSYGYVISATANTANMTPLDANGNALVDANHDGFDDVNTNVAVASYKFTDSYGTTSYFSLSGAKTGYSSSYTNWDGTKSISHYDANNSYIGSSNTDATGKVLNSTMYNYTNGVYTGYTYFDGVTTTVYGANGQVLSSTASTANMTPLDASGNVLVDANHDGFDDVNTTVAVASYKFTDAYGATTTYDLNGTKTGSSYTYYDYWSNTTSVSTYKADGTFLKSVTKAVDGTVVYSWENLYNQDGSYAGYTTFDGANTFTYDANGVLLTDVGPYPISMTLNSDGITIDFSEIAYAPANPADLAFTMLKNGDPALPMNIVSFTGDGTASFTIHTSQTLATGDWVLLNYTGSTVANGIRDALGNVMQSNAPAGYGGSAEGSSAGDVINLSNVTMFSATGGYDINGGLGNDTITGSAASDWIMGGAGADTLTGGTTADHFNFVQDGSSQISFNGSAYVAASGALDRITDFSTGDGLSLNVADSFAPGGMQQGLSMMSLPPMDGLATNQSYFMVQGSYNAGQFTVNGTTGTDTMVVYDSDATAAVAQSGVVLSGVTLMQLGAQVGSNYVSYIGGVTPPPNGGGTISLVSGNDATGLIANASSTPKGLSADGRYVVFESDATNLVANDTNGLTDVFLKDTQTGGITLMSVSAAGVQADGISFGGDISADGRWVTMVSDATNLLAVGIDTNGMNDVFIKDTLTGAVSAESTDASGNLGTGGILGSDVSDMSADRRYLVIGSDATNLVAGDTNNAWDIFLKDTWTGTITRVNTAADGTQVAHTVGADNYLGGFVSDDGRYVVFESDANNLVAGDTNGVMDIFKKDLQTGAITQVNTDVAGAAATGGVGYVDDFATWSLTNEIADISADARYVSFNSMADNLVAGDTNGVRDVFIKDTLTGAITRVNTDAAGAEANALTQAAWRNLSADGRYVVFHSAADNLVMGDTNGVEDSFIKDTLTGAIERLNLDAAGGQAVGGNSNKERISEDGSTIVFRTNATNLVAGHVAGVQDVVSVANPLGGTGGTDTTAPAVIWTGFGIGGAESTFSVDYSESVQASGLGGITAFKNGSVALTVTGATPVTITNPNDSFTFAFTGATLAASDYVVLNYNAGGGSNVTDLAGNPLPSGTMVFDSIGTLGTTGTTIDLTANPLPAGSYSPVYIRTHMGNDTVTGTSGNDIIQTGRGSDIINGSYGADIIKLGESTSYSDTVILRSGMSGFNGANIYSDTIMGFVANGVQVFEDPTTFISAPTGVITASINDKMDLPSGTIAADVTNADGVDAGALMSHSIASGMVTFGSTNAGGNPVTIDAANLNTALAYLQSNITGAGETIAFEYDSDSNGIADSTSVFQNSSAGDDIFAVLNGVTGVTLGTGAGVNVVQLADTTAPQINMVRIAGANSIEVQYSENVAFVSNPNAVNAQILLNGNGTNIVSGGTIAGNVVTVSTSAAMQPTDFLIMTSGNDVADAAGNTTVAGLYAIIGGEGNNTMDFHTSGFSLYMGGFGGNDTIIGSSLSDNIEGGEGADTITGGGGQDTIWLWETTAASDTVVINVGDSTPAGGAADLVHNFDVASVGAQDILDLPSNIIAADTFGFVTGTQSGTIMSHSITNGMISFSAGGGMPGMPVVVGDMANWFDVKNYMAANILDGQTVATYIDMNGNNSYADAVDRLAVFQGHATTDIQVQLYDTMGVVTSLANTLNGNSVTII